MSIEGCANISFKMGNLTLTHKFYVVNNMNRNMILGREWLKQNGVRLYFDLGYLRIGKTYVRLEEDIYVSSLLRLVKKTVLKPQTTTVCMVKLNKGFEVPESGLLEISVLDSGCLSEEPGLTVCKSIAKVTRSRKIPVMVVNETNKWFKLKRGEVMGKGERLKEQDVVNMNINEISKQDENDVLSNINVPEENRSDSVICIL